MNKLMRSLVIAGITLLVVVLVIFFFQLKHLVGIMSHTADDARLYWDTTLFFGKNPLYDYPMQSEIRKTHAYARYRATKSKDSLTIYIKQAESEARSVLKREQ